MINKIKCFGEFYCDIKGNIYNRNFIKLKVSTRKNGYQSISLNHKGNKKTFLVHRLIASSFCVGDNKLDVNHKNCIKNDNRAVNLEWITKSENTRHMYKNNRLDKKGEKQGVAKLKEQDVLNIIKLLSKKCSQSQLARKYNVSKQCINRIHKGLSWCHLPRL